MKTILFYWLKTPGDIDRLEQAVASLAPIPGILDIEWGRPAGYDDHIMDQSFDLCVTITFETEDGLSAMLKDPVHDEASDIFKEV
ncbi:Dabb family protein, partial [Ruminococcaceae bacterium OttesenSCG-928-D13]|nr:Dabb family protein [Ruminococcaceae bacterium OttesenSCG-928-D13]